MRNGREFSRKRDTERGMSIFWVAGGLVFILGVAALTIDLASLYVARNEAQRAADAGALAGAKAYVESGCISGGVGACAATTFTDLAKSRAVAAAGQNSVGGVLVSSLSSNCVTATPFNLSGTDPEITVSVARTAGCGNAMPTFFARIFGFLSGDVSAKATAEAYNGPNICAGCVKPFLLPNCDPVHTSPANPSCSGNGYFIDPTTGAIKHPGPVSSGGVIGQSWTLHWNSGPSQYYDVDVGCGNGDQKPCISGCSGTTLACGSTLSTVQGNRVGQITQGIDALIHDNGIEGPPGSNPPQDTIDTTKPLPFPITGGTNNPNPALVGKTITSSDSLVAVAIYDGHNLGPGHQTVTIVGYMTLFIRYVDSNAHVTAVILGVSGCGTTTATCGSGTISGGGGSLFPIRLVRTPGT